MGGRFLPYQIGCLDHGFRVHKEPKKVISKAPCEYLKYVFIDTVTHDALTLNHLINLIGCKNLNLGSDYPFDMGDAEPVKYVLTMEAVSQSDQYKILGGVALRLMGVN